MTALPTVSATQTAAPQGLSLAERLEKRYADKDAFARHRDHNMSKEVIAELGEKIKAAGTEYIYYQIPTMQGRVVAKVVPAQHFERFLRKGIAMHRPAMADLQTTREGEMVHGGVEAKEFWALPEAETFTSIPWDTTVATIWCRAYEPLHFGDIGGSVLPTDVRSLFKITHEEFTDRTGLELRSGLEPEMTWVGSMADVIVKDGASPAYQVENLERMRPVYKKIIGYAQAMGFNMIQGDYEDDGQIELNWDYDQANLTADRMTTYRQICRQVARELDMQASFMPKPYNGKMGNGCHHNLSLWRGNENVVEDGRVELHATELAKNAIAGALKHTPGSALVMNSTVNSYKRFWDVGQYVTMDLSWGLDGRDATMRISANGRMEYRQPDASVNPYLSHTYLLAAMDDGITNNLNAGEPMGPVSDFAGRTVPRTMGESIDAFEADKYLMNTIPSEVTGVYLDIKKDEWARYCSTLTEWEFTQYWASIP
ncbi:glutamine synthetase family protein [Yaniella flava]|uniref:Glutamine synthetase family protein n=1 Tax=Yaniella flava TaxID=287930 RepID=A0ABN2U7L1_9MICC